MEPRLAEPATEHSQPDAGKFTELDEERECDSFLVDESESLEGGDREFGRLVCLCLCQDFLKLDGEA